MASRDGLAPTSAGLFSERGIAYAPFRVSAARFWLLGPVEVVREGDGTVTLGPAKQRAFLALLADGSQARTEELLTGAHALRRGQVRADLGTEPVACMVAS